MSKINVRPKKSARTQNYATRAQRTAENKMHKLISDLTELEDFRKNILPAIRADVESGMSQAELAKKYAALAQARVITEALTNPDANKALTAAKDIIDRAVGKPTEKKEIKHSLESLNDAELDAVLKSEIAELEEMQERFEQ